MRSGQRGLIAAAILFALTSAATAKPVVIGDDGGGNIRTFAMWYERIRDAGVPVSDGAASSP